MGLFPCLPLVHMTHSVTTSITSAEVKTVVTSFCFKFLRFKEFSYVTKSLSKN